MLQKGGKGTSSLDENFALSQAEKSTKNQDQLENAVDIKVCFDGSAFLRFFKQVTEFIKCFFWSLIFGGRYVTTAMSKHGHRYRSLPFR